MNTRLALLGLAACAFAPAALAQTPAITPLDGGARAAAIAAANRTLNGVTRMQGRFVQTAPGGARATGAFYLQRPGKMRFEYDPPATLLIVSDGSVVGMRDSALRNGWERTPLRSTPLNLILGSQIDLERNARVTRVSRSGDWTMVTVRDRNGQADGFITLNFHGAAAELRSWDVTDATGARTRISLSDTSQPAALDRRLFRLDDVLEPNRRAPR